MIFAAYRERHPEEWAKMEAESKERQVQDVLKRQNNMN